MNSRKSITILLFFLLKLFKMRRFKCLFYVIFILFSYLNCDGQEDIKCYISTGDFVQKRIYDVELRPKIKSKSDQFIKISKFINIKENEKDDQASIAWALLVDRELYINMRYSHDYQNIELYVKPHITGKICAIIIDDNTDQKILSGGTNYGVGFQGVLMKESQKWGKNWIDEHGIKHKILIFNTTFIKSNHLNRNVNVSGELLTKKNFNDLLGLALNKDEIDTLSYEKIIAFIKSKNE